MLILLAIRTCAQANLKALAGILLAVTLPDFVRAELWDSVFKIVCDAALFHLHP